MTQTVIVENKNGVLKKVEESFTTPKNALIDYVQRTVMFDYSAPILDYIVSRMREGEPDHWYYDNGATTIAAYPAR